ncbi:hypothetical protein, partial [Chromobacterium amazonense]|uniref:hypothetical protein n=1 Tax=Chromobacterium amazonense TaxID=1382803 RepID=UPI003F7931DD
PVYEWHEQGALRPMTAAGWIEWLQREQGKDEAEARTEVVRLIHQQAMLEVDRQFTTPAARAREQFILAAEREGRDAALPLIG